MADRGAIVQEYVAKSGVKLIRLCEQLNMSRPTLYRRFDDPNVSFEFIEAVGKLIRHDFGQQFPQLRKAAAEPEALPTQLDTLTDCKDQLLHVYGLYTDILQKYNALLKQGQQAQA